MISIIVEPQIDFKYKFEMTFPFSIKVNCIIICS